MKRLFQRKQTEANNEVTDFSEIRDAFIQYVASESNLLKLDDFSKNNFQGQYIGYDCGYKTGETQAFGGHEIFLSAGLNFQNDYSISKGILAASLVFTSDSEYFQSHYKKMEERRIEMEQCFLLKGVKFKQVGRTHRISMERWNVDLSQRENWQPEFQWLRENLEKLYFVLRVYNTFLHNTLE